MKSSMFRNGLILAAFAVVTTMLIALTFSGTEQTIISQQQKKLQGILSAIIPAQLHDNDMRTNCTFVTSQEFLGSAETQTVFRATKDSQKVALALETVAPDGYSGKIKLVVGMDTSGTVTGVRILEHKETPGLGDRIDIRISDWITSFNGQVLTEQNESMWAVRKDGGQFDQFTGATITPRAVVSAVKKAVEYVKIHQQEIFAAVNQCAVTSDENEVEG